MWYSRWRELQSATKVVLAPQFHFHASIDSIQKDKRRTRASEWRHGKLFLFFVAFWVCSHERRLQLSSSPCYTLILSQLRPFPLSWSRRICLLSALVGMLLLTRAVDDLQIHSVGLGEERRRCSGRGADGEQKIARFHPSPAHRICC